MAKCTSIVKLDSYPEGIDMLRVTIDNEIEAYMIYSYADSLQFVDQEVIVTYRKDLYQGKIETFINTLTIPVKVSTLDREDRIKLFVKEEDNNSNVSLIDIQEGEYMVGAILYCVECFYESSAKAAWLTMKVRDRSGRIAKLRLFDYDNRDANYAGSYIKATVRRTQYGYNTDEVVPLNAEFSPNPEISIAKTFIQRYFIEDMFIRNCFHKTQLLEKMENFVDIERGYALVRMAMELDVVEELKNIFDDVNFTAITYAIVMKYGYVAKAALKDYSDSLRAIAFTLQQGLPADVGQKVLMILDPGEVEVPAPERVIYQDVVSLVDSIIKTKKVV